MDQKITTLYERPGLSYALNALNQKVWPEFLMHWPCPEWRELFGIFKPFQVLVLDPEENLIGFGHAAPFYWHKELILLPESLREILGLAVNGFHRGLLPNYLIALAVVVSPQHRGGGISSLVLSAMKKMAIEQGIGGIIVPVRPTKKAQYPLIPIADYATWKNADGLPFDPWLRIHHRLEAKIYRTSENCMEITGAVAEWEKWTELTMPASGEYVVPGALRPVTINRESDRGVYTDPCVWVRYELR